MMAKKTGNPRVLIVTPEVSYLPQGMEDNYQCCSAGAGGLGDVSAALISALYGRGIDVHLAMPDYRTIFNSHMPLKIRNKIRLIRQNLPHEKIHLAQDRAFFYLNRIYSGSQEENIEISLAFQREVINHIVPIVQPDLIHVNDWMTGLIPAMARELGIPCLFSLHNTHTAKVLLSHIEDKGIDVADFWRNLYFDQYPISYENARNHIPVDLLTSGIFAAHYVNTSSPTFLDEITDGHHDFVSNALRQELSNKKAAVCAAGILNAPDSSFNPSSDERLYCRYSEENYEFGKRENKRHLQKIEGLIENPNAPLLFWPSMLDVDRYGCQLLADILYKVVSRYREMDLEIIFVASGPFAIHYKDIVRFHGLESHVAVCHFDESLSRLAYGASDFVLIPSKFEPGGLFHMIAPIYGTLPIVRDTGGFHDNISHLDAENNTGNGFVFETFDSNGLSWAIDEAMIFFLSSPAIKGAQISRIMAQSRERFCYDHTAAEYIRLYEQMLNRPLVMDDSVKKGNHKTYFYPDLEVRLSALRVADDL